MERENAIKDKSYKFSLRIIKLYKFLIENKVQIESWGPFAEGRNDIFKNELLASIGKKYNKTIQIERVLIKILPKKHSP